MHRAKQNLFLRKYQNEKSTLTLSDREEAALKMLPAGGVLVELGCGTGGLLRMAAGHYETALGLDVLGERLRRAAAQGVPRNVGFLMLDMDNGLPFRDGTVSCVVCVGTFEYAYDPFFLLLEVGRVLVPRGAFLVQVANLLWLPRRLRLMTGRVPPTGSPVLIQDRCWNGGYLHAFSLHDLKLFLHECGFKVERLASSGRYRRIVGAWPSVLASDFVILCRKV